MNFKTRDLLFFTAIVAIYCAAFSLTEFDNDTKRWLSTLVMLLVPAGVAGTIYYYKSSSSKLAGKRLASCRIRNWWWLHFFLAFTFLAVAFYFYLAEYELSLREIFLQLIVQHIVFASLPNLAICKNGVLSGFGFLPWSDYRFWIDEQEHLNWKRTKPSTKLNFSSDFGKVRLPKDDLETFRKILAENQPAAEEETNTTQET